MKFPMLPNNEFLVLYIALQMSLYVQQLLCFGHLLQLVVRSCRTTVSMWGRISG